MASKISTLAQLRSIYGTPSNASIKKQASELNPTYKRWVEHSCFFVIASVGQNSIDCAPRGDPHNQAFVIADNKTILIPDRRGNNRLDTLSNIVSDPRVALLFFIPGVEQTLRIVGQASISTETALLEQFTLNGQLPLTCISVTIDAVYFQNSRALARSGMWTTEHSNTATVPTPEQMLDSVEDDADEPTRKF